MFCNASFFLKHKPLKTISLISVWTFQIFWKFWKFRHENNVWILCWSRTLKLVFNEIHPLILNANGQSILLQEIPRIPKSVDCFQLKANCSCHSNFQTYHSLYSKTFQIAIDTRIAAFSLGPGGVRGLSKVPNIERAFLKGVPSSSTDQSWARFSLCDGFLWANLLLGADRVHPTPAQADPPNGLNFIF